MPHLSYLDSLLAVNKDAASFLSSLFSRSSARSHLFLPVPASVARLGAEGGAGGPPIPLGPVRLVSPAGQRAAAAATPDAATAVRAATAATSAAAVHVPEMGIGRTPNLVQVKIEAWKRKDEKIVSG